MVNGDESITQAVRYLFTTDGRLIDALDQLEDGCSYVCSSNKTFRRLDYEKTREKIGADDDLSPRDIVPRTICVLRAGARPRNYWTHVLNRRTTNSYEQLLAAIEQGVKMSCAIKRIYATSGRQVFRQRSETSGPARRPGAPKFVLCPTPNLTNDILATVMLLYYAW